MPGFSILLAAMFLELMLAPLFGMPAGGLRAARVFTAIVLLAALSVVGVGRAALVLFIPALVAQLLASYSGAPGVVLVAAVLRFLFLGYVLALVVRYVLSDRIVTLDTIAGTACAYVLLGFVWGNLFQLVEHLHPGSFEIPSSWLGPDRDPGATLIFFSFVTLTTVGYGIIHPTGPGPGALCVAEALVGQLYLAIMIARMVGLHLAQRAK